MVRTPRPGVHHRGVGADRHGGEYRGEPHEELSAGGASFAGGVNLLYKRGMTSTTAFKGDTVNLSGDLPAVGASLPAFTLTNTELATVDNSTYTGQTVVFNIFPSVDTGVCAASVRQFNELATKFDGVTIVNVSRDLPFALGRFCGSEGIENADAASDFRGGFGEAFGNVQVDGPLAGLLGRAVVIADGNGEVIYTELVPEITTEPDYDAAAAALS